MLSEITHEIAPQVGVVFSEYANLFPMMEGVQRDNFKKDIAENGVRNPVVFMGPEILDGRNRYTIARELGIEYPRCDYLGDDPAGFVISQNLSRRHLNDAQRAMVATKLAKLPHGAHSAKPEVFAEMIEAYFPSLPKIELNRRGPARENWAAWGNESEEIAA